MADTMYAACDWDEPRIDHRHLREHRVQAGLTQQQVARMAKVSKRTIEDYESEVRGGAKHPTLRVLDRIAHVLKVAPEDLLQQPDVGWRDEWILTARRCEEKDRPAEAALWYARSAAAAARRGIGELSQLLLTEEAKCRRARGRIDGKDPRQIPFFDEDGRQIGLCTRWEAHQPPGMLHRSVILLARRDWGEEPPPGRDPKKNLISCVRTALQDTGGKNDLLGGHHEEHDRDLLTTALREANEELQLHWYGRRLALSRLAFRRAENGCLKEDRADNREHATLFLVTVPSGAGISCGDMVFDGAGLATTAVTTIHRSLDELRQLVLHRPDSCADGLRRVIQAYEARADMRESIDAWIDGR